MSNFLTTTLERLRSRPKVTGVVVRIVATYVLLGAAAKVLWGAPSDLPAALLQMVRWDERVLFDLVIFVELFVAGLAIVSPKIGWPLVSAALTGFVIVLVQQLRGGETSCGCFGSALTVPTQVMLGIDLLALTGMALVQAAPETRIGVPPIRHGARRERPRFEHEHPVAGHLRRQLVGDARVPSEESPAPQELVEAEPAQEGA